MTRRQTSGASSQVVPLPPVMPALLTRMSILPAAPSARAAAAGDGGLVGQLDLLGDRRWPASPSVPFASASLAASASQSATVAPEREHALGDGVADALRAAGDDGDAAFEIDLVHAAFLRRGPSSDCGRVRRRRGSRRCTGG